MQIKSADDKQRDIDTLEALLTRTDLGAGTRRDVENEIRAIRAGVAGERDAAYEIDFYFGESKNFVTIHDLRLEVGGLTAQIDHLIIDRLLEVWVCESKSFAEGVSINEFGEWRRYFRGKPMGIASPIEQNLKHIHVLDRAFGEGLVKAPRRIVALKPVLKSVVLISKNASIGRPRRKFEGLDSIVKADQLWSRVQKHLDETSIWNFRKVVSQDTIAEIGQQLVALHRPISFDWTRRFGLAEATPGPTDATAARAEPRHRGSGHRCASCGEPVSFAVVKFCWNNERRFGGKVYCIPCQQRASPPAPH